jgi:hypothetical protein
MYTRCISHRGNIIIKRAAGVRRNEKGADENGEMTTYSESGRSTKSVLHMSSANNAEALSSDVENE